VLQQQAERGLGQGGHHADLDAGRGELGQRLVDTRERQYSEPVRGRAERGDALRRALLPLPLPDRIDMRVRD